MEIFIRLSGVQLGPYSAEQVRQHITDGLITLDDPAKLEGMDDWAPLRDILPPDEESGEGESNPGVRAQAGPPDNEPIESPVRAPSASPGVSHLPSRAQPVPDDASTQSGKTGLFEPTAPTAPIRAPNPGQSVPLATTSPLASVNQATKKISRTDLVKQLSQRTSPLPTRAINAPPKPPVTTPIPLPEGKRDLAGLLKSLTAKTVPIRKGPVPPIGAPTPTPLAPVTAPKDAPALRPDEQLRPTIQTTEPMPTRHIYTPGPGAASRKETIPARPEQLEHMPIQTTEPLPTRNTFKSAAKKDEPESRVEEKPSAPTLPGRAGDATTVDPAPPVFKTDEAPPSKTRSASEPPASAADSTPGAASSEPAPVPPRSSRRLLPVFIGACAVLAGITLYYVWSPYHAADAFRSALTAGDSAGLDATVDFPAVRQGLKAQLDDMVSRTGVRDDLAPAGTRSPVSTVRDILENSVDAYVTPDGIAGLIANKDGEGKWNADAKPEVISPGEAARILLATSTQPVDNEGLASLSDFVMDRGAAMLHLKLSGGAWKVKQVELRPDLASPGPSGSAAPLVSPVVETILEQGRQAAARHGKTAVADFTLALAIDPKSSDALNERATVRQQLGDLDGAIGDYTQALAIDPQMAPAYNGRANAKSAKNDYDGAIADYSQAIHYDATLATAYDGRGNARIAKDDANGALSDFTQAIAIDPNLAAAYSDRGFARQANGNPDGAIADYTQALALSPKSGRTYFNRGLAKQAQGNPGAAILDFDQALALDPTMADAYYYRGNAKSANHDLDGAIADYEKAVGLNPKLAPAFTNMGLARQAKGDLAGAVNAYTLALSVDPKVATAYFNRSVIEAQQNDLDDAIADSTQAIYLDGKNAQAYNTRGFAKLAKGNLDGALTDLKQFSDLAPRDRDTDHVRLYLWLIAKAQNSGADADQDLSTALGSSWNSAPR